MMLPPDPIKPTSSLSFSSFFTPKSSFKLYPISLPSISISISKPRTTISFKLHSSSSSSSSSQSQSPNPPPSSDHSHTPLSILRAIPDWADSVKERGMRRNRKLYNHEKWVQHRSSLRHLRHVMSSLSSRVILSLVPPVIAFTSFAVLIAGYNSAVLVHWLPDFFPVLKASTLPYQLTAPALALLLVFRTEASYSRFQEGRKAWIRVTSATNDLATQVIAGIDNSGNDAPLKKALLQYIMAFPVALKCHLMYASDVRQDLQNLLDIDDLAIILNSKHRPCCIIEFISQSLRLLKLEESRRNMLESKISYLHEGIAVCEQLMGIPIPLSYTRLTSRFLVLWHLTLPIILWDDCHWIVVPATFISAASLFCIEEVGVLIEEPFPMLALDEFCKLVHNKIEQAIANDNELQAHMAAKLRSHSMEHSPNGYPNS